MSRLTEMEAFVAVVNAGSFTAAADHLGIGKSVVSRRVAALEARLGVELLRRTTRRLSVTESGRSFHEQAARILADLDEAESAAAQEHGDLRGSLRIALPLSFGIRHMCGVISEFSARHPGVEFDLDLNDRRVDLFDEQRDLAIRIGRLEDSSLIARRLFDARTVVCAAPSYLERRGTPATIDDLREHDCLVYTNVPNPDRWVCTDSNGERHRIALNVAMRASSGDFLCAAAANGLGIAMQPTFIAGELISRGDLVPLLTQYQWPVTPAWAIYPPTRHLSFRVRAFIDFVAERFAGMPPWDEGCSPH